jgi:16S rRNA (uracil1498-N3)-methyltransferase
VLNEPSRFKEFITKDLKGIRMIAHCNETIKRDKISDVYTKNENAIILIGPEGDFSIEEIDSAVESEFFPVHLGPSRLRTETAGIAACHSIYFINQ